MTASFLVPMQNSVCKHRETLKVYGKLQDTRASPLFTVPASVLIRSPV